MSTTAWTMHDAVVIRSSTGGGERELTGHAHGDEQNIRNAVLEVGSAPDRGIVDQAVRIIAGGNAEGSSSEVSDVLRQAGVEAFYLTDDDADTD